MIRVTINHSGIHSEERELTIDKMYYGNSMDEIIIESKGHVLKPDDVITFIENDDDQRYYRERRGVLYVIDDDHFAINGFPDRIVYPVSATTATTTCYVGENEEPIDGPIVKRMNYLKFTFSERLTHDMVKYRGDVRVIDNIDELYYYGEPDRYTRRCIGDYVLCDRMLYKATGITDNYKFEIPIDTNEILNISDKRIYFTGMYGNRITLGGEELIDGEDIYLKTTSALSENDVYGVLITPLTYYGKDSRTELFWVFDAENEKHNDIVKYLLDNFSYCDFHCKDERFFTEKYGWEPLYDVVIDKDSLYSGSTENVTWRDEGKIIEADNDNCSKYSMCTCVELVPNTKETCDGEVRTTYITRDYGFYDITIPASDDYGVDLLRNELLNDMFIDQEKSKLINDIIDYERVQFTPMYAVMGESGETIFHPVSKIKFGLHFRARPYDEEEGIERDYGDFETSDSYYWNTASMVPSNTSYTFTFDNYDSDLLGDIGFTDNDVYYQKKKLKNTFLRISCYDTKYRSTQSLLGYSTIFLDSGKFYKKYVSTIVNNEATEDIVYKDGITNRLGVEFECESKYSTEMSSDGFYIYTYPTIVNGTLPTTAYLKVEFNHAKYGKTIPMSYPTYGEVSGHTKGDPILVSDNEFSNNFPINYRKYGSQIPDDLTYSGTATSVTVTKKDVIDIDVQKVFENSYIKIRLKYDDVKNQYIWYIVNEDGVTPESIINPDTGELTLVLWEPRLNGILQEENELSTNNGE